jgi:hypothetical protein
MGPIAAGHSGRDPGAVETRQRACRGTRRLGPAAANQSVDFIRAIAVALYVLEAADREPDDIGLVAQKDCARADRPASMMATEPLV